MNYYNDNDPFCCQWLRNLIEAEHIGAGAVDERSICDIKPDDLRGFDHCHFFAGIAGWEYALQLAEWPSEVPVWTGSCPCQPFSAAGKRKADEDSRHLWPVWFNLIRSCRPSHIFGEQVEAAIGIGWLDRVFDDLEAEGYSCGAVVLPACCVGAPHIRARVFWVADASEQRRQQIGGRSSCDEAAHGREGRNECEPDGHYIASGDGSDRRMADADGWHSNDRELQRSGQQRQQQEDNGACGMADATDARRAEEGQHGSGLPSLPARSEQCGGIERMGDTELARREKAGSGSQIDTGRQSKPGCSPWSDSIWLPCSDGKWRRTQSRIRPLAARLPGRVGQLRAYGNSIVPQVAAEFIKAFMEIA